MDGVIVIDKPAGPTSHDVVLRVRRATGERRIGHTGTLDPAASGVLPLVIGRATRLARFLSSGDKQYEAVIRLGFSTDTGDAQGVPVGGKRRGDLPSRGVIDAMLDKFRGTFPQRPPEFSAKKIDGRRSYELARGRSPLGGARGDPERVEGSAFGIAQADRELVDALGPPAGHPAPVMVTAHSIDIVRVEGDSVTLRIACSAGFYVRSLARDLGDCLGTGGHLVNLRRTASSGFTLADAVPLERVERNRHDALTAVIPLNDMLPGLRSVVLTVRGRERAVHGRDLGPADVIGPLTVPATDDSWIRLVDAQGGLIGLAQPAQSGALHPSVVLV